MTILLSATALAAASAFKFSVPWLNQPSPPPPAVDCGMDPTLVVYWIVLITVLADFILTLVSSVLNYQRLSPSMPLDCADIYDAAAYCQSQEYTKAKTKFSLLRAVFDTLVFILFWGACGFERLDVVVRAAVPAAADDDLWVQIPRGLLYWFALGLAGMLLDIPWSVYHTFVLEERFGFNKTSVGTFVVDQLKGLALTLLIGPPVGATALAFFLYCGDYAWLYCWLFICAVQLALALAVPVFILPLFNTFTPLPEGDIKDEIHKYAAQVGFQFAGVFEVDGSKRSSHSNAYFVGLGSTKRIALFDTLVKQSTREELLAVLAHEVGHERLGHIKTNLAIGFAYMLVLLALAGAFLSYSPLFGAFCVSEPSVYVGLMLFTFLFSPIDSVLRVVLSAHSRHNEFAADRFSVQTYKHPEALVCGLKRLAKENLTNLTPHPLHVFLNYSHPPLTARIDAIRASQLGASQGEQGERVIAS